MVPVRGCQSSVNYELAFGLGKTTTLDSVLVIWPDSSVQTLYQVKANKTLLLNQKDAKVLKMLPDAKPKVFSESAGTLGIKFTEAKGSLPDFKRDRMIPNSISTSG